MFFSLWRHNNIFWKKYFFSVDFSKKIFVSKIAYSPGPSSKNVKVDIFYVKVA